MAISTQNYLSTWICLKAAGIRFLDPDRDEELGYGWQGIFEHLQSSGYTPTK
jgi:hypothetical protein